MFHRHTTKTAQERPEERDKELKMSTRPPKSPDPDPIKHLGKNPPEHHT